jgi:hypothetical protein
MQSNEHKCLLVFDLSDEEKNVFKICRFFSLNLSQVLSLSFHFQEKNAILNIQKYH